MKMKHEIKKIIMIEGTEDYLVLWSIIREIKELNRELNAVSIKSKTIQFIEELLNNQLIHAGNFNAEHGFEIWQIPNEKIVDMIEEEWKKLDREPNIGEIVWFVSTRKGELEAKKLYSKA